MAENLHFAADWPAPVQVRTAITLRGTGPSPYGGNNLALHVGDEPDRVLRNRRRLAESLGLGQWQWLEQVHGTEVKEASDDGSVLRADGSYSRQPGRACVVLTADCLPVLLCDRAGTQVAAVHAGWRGLVQGILPVAVKAFAGPATDLMAYLGPAISQPHYEIDQPVIDEIERHWPDDNWRQALKPSSNPGRYHLDLFHLARLALQRVGVSSVFGGNHCTFTGCDSFYSYRRDGVTGRFASAIWLQP